MMKRNPLLLIFLFSTSFSLAQTVDIGMMVDSLKYMKNDTLDCKADLYWRIIAKGEKAIPFLIDKLADTTQTKISFRCKKTKLNVGEVCYFALTQIADFPAFVVTKIQFDVYDGRGCWGFYDFLFNDKNKIRYQQMVRDWYKREKGHYRAEKISNKMLTGCLRKYNIRTRYRWKGNY